MKVKPPLKFLTDEQLNKLNTKRLLGVLNSIRAVESSAQIMLRSPMWEQYDGWILGDKAWDEYVVKPTAHLTSYKNKVKSILSKREHIE